MKVKVWIMATLLGGVGMIVLAGLWHELIMAQFYATHKGAMHEGTHLIMVAYFILAGLMSYLYQTRRIGLKSIKEGAIFGAVIGVLWVFPHELVMAAAHGEAMGYVMKNGLWHLIEQAFGGVLIAWVYIKKDV